MSWEGFALGALGLAALDLIVSHPAAYGRLGAVAAGAGSLVERFLSPTVPLFAKKGG
jgi:hypothetical protein